jgi:hypothetical protein
MMADASPRTDTSTDDTDENNSVSPVDLDLSCLLQTSVTWLHF